jgi:hypothetical protein
MIWLFLVEQLLIKVLCLLSVITLILLLSFGFVFFEVSSKIFSELIKSLLIGYNCGIFLAFSISFFCLIFCITDKLIAFWMAILLLNFILFSLLKEYDKILL